MSASHNVDRKTFFSELNPKIFAVKAGTGVLEEYGKLNIDKVDEIAEGLSMLRKKGDEVEVCYVSSGAILAAMDKLETNKGEFRKKYPNDEEYLQGLQLLSGIGQPLLMGTYEDAFDKHNQLISQVLITENDRSTYKDVVQSYAQNKVIPIINENDNLSTKEITLGDNDNLAVTVTVDLDADLLIILSDTILYDKDPQKYEDAMPVYEVHNITEEMIKNAASTGPWGTGGMQTKLKAAKKANEANIPVALLDGKNRSISDIERLLNGERIGTLFIPGNY